MKLFGTPLSHFTRKVRILLDLYGLPYEFVDIGNVAMADMAAFQNNPLMKVPVLIDGETWIIDSDHIAQYIVQKFDSEDRHHVRLQTPMDLNIRAVLNSVMIEEVKVILARRTSVPTDQYVFFAKALLAIENGLQWLEQNVDSIPSSPAHYLRIHLVCLWDHLSYFDLVSLEKYPGLKSLVVETSKEKAVARTAPLVLKPK